jgi:hypothetical protein
MLLNGWPMSMRHIQGHRWGNWKNWMKNMEYSEAALTLRLHIKCEQRSGNVGAEWIAVQELDFAAQSNLNTEKQSESEHTHSAP